MNIIAINVSMYSIIRSTELRGVPLLLAPLHGRTIHKNSASTNIEKIVSPDANVENKIVCEIAPPSIYASLIVLLFYLYNPTTYFTKKTTLSAPAKPFHITTQQPARNRFYR
jgi:hypothetical protein